MEQKGKIIEIIESKARIEVVRNSACSADCDSCKGCSHGTQKLVIYVPINEYTHKIGDIVSIHSKSSTIVSLAYVAYILPIIMMFLGYYFARNTGEGTAIVCSFLGLAVGFLFCYIINKMMKQKVNNLFSISGE